MTQRRQTTPEEDPCYATWPAGRPWCMAWGNPTPVHGCAIGRHSRGEHVCKCGDRCTAPMPMPRVSHR